MPKQSPLTDKDRVDLVERHVNLLADLGAREDNLARDENEEHDLGLHHAVNQAGKELRVSCGRHADRVNSPLAHTS